MKKTRKLLTVIITVIAVILLMSALNLSSSAAYVEKIEVESWSQLSNDPRRACRCSVGQIEKYMARVSGPLLDRIDVHIETPPVSYLELSSDAPRTSSAEVRAQVLKARAIQAKRYAGSTIRTNAQMRRRELERWAKLDDAGRSVLESAMNEFGFSARAHDKILRVARTIADLEGAENIETPHLFEAIGYRALDRKLWT